MKANGSKQRQLTHLNGFATFPDFSPDGKTIAFGGTAGADPGTQIHTVNAKTGGDLHTLTSCAGFGEGCFNDLPVWSPDGTKTCSSMRTTGTSSRTRLSTNRSG